MKTLEISILEEINGGGFCNSVTVADAVVAVGGGAAYMGWITLTPAGVGILAGAGVALAGVSLYCAFR